MKLYLAGGCFWGVEAFFQRVPGAMKTEVGYINGKYPNPSYEDLLYKNSGHAEGVMIDYLPSLISYEKLLEYFFYIIDPTSVNKQGNDVGVQYRTGIYYTNEEEHLRAKKWLEQKAKEYSKPLAVELAELKEFSPAENYHQYYLNKNPQGYCHVNLPKALARVREDRIAGLAPLAYQVTQQAGTEPAYSSEYDNLFEPGIYFDVISGAPLFAAGDKFPCPCGWPSFAKPIVPEAVTYHDDYSYNMFREEVRSASSGAHLGHVFDDGPVALGRRRFCINGAAIKFVPQAEIDAL